MEKFLQNKQYEYRANSNLVLEADRDYRRRDDGKGEVESLKTRVHSIKMGERTAARERLETDRIISEVPSKKRRVRESPVVGKTIAQQGRLENVYIPKSIECRRAYEEFLAILKSVIGDVSNEMLQGGATEVLEIMKDPNMTTNVQKKEVSNMIPGLSDESFRQLVSFSGRITDFCTAPTEVVEAADIGEGMAVVFDDDEDENELEDDDDDDIEVEAAIQNQPTKLIGEVNRSEKDNIIDGKLAVKLLAHDIDAYWLQRQLAKFYSDPNVCSKIADDVLETLSIDDERLCENNLVLLLDFDKFDIIKFFLQNRLKIYYCVKLKQSQSETSRIAIENEMKSNNEGYILWKELNEQNITENWTRDRFGNNSQLAVSESHVLGVHDDSCDDLEEKKVDLEDLSFKEGGHLMTNSRCELPEKSWRAQKKGYEEVHVPAVKPFVSESEKLVEISSLDDWMHPVFDGVRHLNRIQSKMCSTALRGTENMLLCAPTGSGKTNVALLCMLGVIEKFRNLDGIILRRDFKIVYIAPMKALVQECVQNFSKRLDPLHLVVRELSGDQSLSGKEIQETNVIVTTPEKWDVVTRKSMDRNFTQTVKLIIIDEIHLLHDERGPVLEAIVARTLRQSEMDGDNVRIVGLSATLPNYHDVATFLRVDPDSGLFFFDSSYRPVPLQQQFIGVTEKKVLKKVQIMNEICYEKALLHAGKNQILIFTHSRADTVKTAKALRDLAVNDDNIGKFIKEDSASSEILRTEAANVKNTDLRDILPFGFAVHHAGLQRSDRSLVEDLFADKHVQVLVSTATLAWGVNLPCHTVIIKGTQIYSPEKGGWTELSPLDTLQMIGRAGRYGLDSEGEGIIITNHSELQYYLSLVNNQLPIESQMIKRLPDLLNAEIVAGSISTVEDAAEWLGYTYLYVRMMKNPSLYGIDSKILESDKSLFGWRRGLARAALMTLEKNDLIKFDRGSGSIISTHLGRICSHYYITNETMATYKNSLRPSMNEIDILRLFGQSSEFKFIYVKEEEKVELSKLIARVPVPIKESYEEPVAKVNVLLQSYISKMKLEVIDVFNGVHAIV
jgi:pre-mRNA-splicing helicase BRR2